MHTCGQKGSTSNSVFETSLGRLGLLKAGVLQPHEASGEGGGSEVVFDNDGVARRD